jgi:hypothetical protein
VAALAFVSLLALVREARAQVLEAPVGGRSFLLGDARSPRVACATPAGGWTLESGARAAKPPASASAIGTVTPLKVASAPGECARSSETMQLVATGAWPRVDPTSFTLAVDEGRLEGRGHGLRGVVVTWSESAAADKEAPRSDTCRDPRSEGGSEACAWGVPRGTPADPAAPVFRLWPAGAVPAQDAVLFDADGKRSPASAWAIVLSRVDVNDLLPPDASVDVSSGEGRLPLPHPEVLAAVECAPVACSMEDRTLRIVAPPASATGVDVRIRLVPHVFYTRHGARDTQATLHVNVVRCPMAVASGRVLRGVPGTRAVVRLEGACASDASALRFFAGTRRLDVVQIETIRDAAYAVLSVGDVDAPSLSIVAARDDASGTVVAIARTDTIAPPAIRTVLEIPGLPPLDFVPNNRPAIVHFPKPVEGTLVLLSQRDLYSVHRDDAGVTTVQGDFGASGAVTLKLGFRDPSLPAPLDAVDLAVLPDSLQRSVHEANTPAPFGASALTATPLAELICLDEEGRPRRIPPGPTEHVPFSQRGGCRVVIHRERLSPEYGTQKVSLEIEVDKLDGSARGEAHVAETLALRAGPEPMAAWIKGVAAPYDRALVRLSQVADEAHYVNALEISSGAPAVQWNVIFGSGHVRLYATSAIPTGLYRFGTPKTSGVMSLSFGILSRLTWLDGEGHEGLLGLEGGIMAFGLTGDQSSSGESLTQVGLVLGVGLSIPIAGAGAATQASINLHGWFEQRVTGSGGEAESGQALVFGPSISIGNIGTTF